MPTDPSERVEELKHLLACMDPLTQYQTYNRLYEELMVLEGREPPTAEEIPF